MSIGHYPKAVEDVVKERMRQIYIEGWSTRHDDEHDPGDLAFAGISYALNAACVLNQEEHNTDWPKWWPWSLNWWKPTIPRRDLVKAAALIIAEIEKIDRATDRSK